MKNFTATVVSCMRGDEAPDVFYLKLRTEKPLEAKPGQFVMLESFFSDKIWRRPFSVFIQESNYFVVRIKVKGKNTEYYSKLKPGDKISVEGPLGKPIIIDDYFKKAILVAGGDGIAGLILLASKLNNLPVETVCLYGNKSQGNKIDKKLLKLYNCKVKTIIEKKGKGLATDLLAEELKTGRYKTNSIIIACGPNAMLEKTAEIAAKFNIPCQVVTETLVACGVGSCKGCVIPRVGGGNFHLCQDGPALPADKVDWAKLERPSVIVPLERRVPVEKINMKTVLAGQGGKKLILPSPIITCAGCLDLEKIENGTFDLSKVGAITTKGLSLEPRIGNKGPRVAEVPGGMLNAIGLENVGLGEFLEQKLPRWQSFGRTVIVNIFGNSVDEYAELAEILYKHGIRVVELNISCPNKKENEEIFALSKTATFKVVKAVKVAVPKIFIIVKLSPIPDGNGLKEIAQMAVKGGADALACFNTYPGLKIDLKTRRPALGNTYGGYSGPGAIPIALRKVRMLYEMDLGIPLIGQTGIDSGDSAAEYIIAGAQAVGIGTALFSDPEVVLKTVDELRETISEYGMASAKELVGSMIK